MNEDVEIVQINANPTENAHLARMFQSFYKIEAPISVMKSSFVTKDSYNKAIRLKLRERTPFEPDRAFKDMVSFQNSPCLEVLKAKISITFPSSRVLTLLETLTEPNGLTKTVELTDSDGNSCTFNKYIEAEGEVVSRLNEEMGGLIGNAK